MSLTRDNRVTQVPIIQTVYGKERGASFFPMKTLRKSQARWWGEDRHHRKKKMLSGLILVEEGNESLLRLRIDSNSRKSFSL